MSFCKIAFALPLVLLQCCPTAFAQTNYPTKPIRLIVPFPAGAASDVVGRMLGQKMSEILGEQVVADNRAGAGGNLGIGLTAKAPPDGYTILIATASIAVSPAIYANLGFDPAKDLAPVARLSSTPNILLVHPSVPAKTLREFINLARAAPGKLNFGSGGAGTTNHLANELLKHLEKINIVHVPYKGVTQAMTAMMGGEVDEVVMPVTTAIPQIRAGKVRALAVTSTNRSPLFPDIPTMAEAGYPGYEDVTLNMLLAPAGTPKEIVAKIHADVAKAFAQPELVARFVERSIELVASPSPEDFGQLIRSEVARLGKVAREAGIKAE